MKKFGISTLALTAILCAACSTSSPAAPTQPAAQVAPTAVPTTAPTLAPTVAPTVAPKVAPAAAAATGGTEVSEAEVRKVADALSALSSYRIHGEMKDDNGKTVSYSMEFVKPDRQHMTVTTADQSFETISVGTATYVKMGGTWTKSPTGADTVGSMVPFSNADDITNAFKEGATSGEKLVKGAVDSVDGVQCQEWTSTAADSNNTQACIGLSDSLPHRFSTPEGDISFSDFNAPLKIEAPI